MGLKRFIKRTVKTAINPALGFNPARKALENTSVGRRLESAYDVQKLSMQRGLTAIGKNPTRLLTGIDPVSTELWNKIKGTDDQALVNLYGSPTKDTFREADARGIDTKGARDFFKIGDGIAGFIGGSAALGGLSNAYNAARAGGTAAGGSATGVGGLPAVNVGPTSTAGLGTVGAGTAGTVGAGGAAAGGGGAATGLGGLSTGQLIGMGGQALAGVGSYLGAKESAKGAQAGIDEIARQYDTTRADLAPWRNTGSGAVTMIGALNGIGPDGKPTGMPVDYSAFRDSPGYQFNLGEGLKAVEGSAAARGGLYSGAAMKALQARGAGIADSGFSDYYNRLLAAAGLGQTATSTSAQIGANAASNTANLLSSAGDARASGISSLFNGVGNAASMYGGFRYGNQYPYGGG